MHSTVRIEKILGRAINMSQMHCISFIAKTGRYVTAVLIIAILIMISHILYHFYYFYLSNANKNFGSGVKWKGRSGYRKQTYFYFRP